MDATGFKIAKAGFDALTTGDQNLFFSSDLSAMPIYQTGTVTPVLTSWSGGTYIDYYSSVVTFPEAFPTPPLVWACGIAADYREASILVSRPNWGGKDSFGNWPYNIVIAPHYLIESAEDQFSLHVSEWGIADCPTWRYFVMGTVT